MTSIHRIDHSISSLRKLLSKNRSTNQNFEIGGTEHKGQPQAETEALKTHIRNQLLELDLTNPDHQISAATIFLEAVLTNEYGCEIKQSAGFYNLLADVREAMLTNPLTRQELVTALSDLKSGT